MNKEYILQLIDRYLAGETTPAEETVLANADLPEEWRFMKDMLAELSDGAAEYDRIMAERETAKKRLAISWRWISVAAVGLVLFSFAWQWTVVEKPAVEPQGKERAASTPPSVTSLHAVGIAKAEETSVRPGVRLHQIEAGRQSRTEIDSYAEALEDSPAGDNPHDESWGYRQSRGSATLPSRTAAAAVAAVQAVQMERAVYSAPVIYSMRELEPSDEVVIECERDILEYEFQKTDVRIRTVSL